MMMGAPTSLFVQALGLAVAFMASLGLASGQACNAGVQYFALPGYKTAAVFADGVMMLPPDFVFGDQAPLAKRAMERRNFAADPIAVGNNLLYLETDTERILFDTGNGPSDDGSGVGFLLPSLAAQGIPADSITAVCITHGHPDHVSGLVVDSNGTKAFPAATVYVPRVEFEYWMGQPGTPGEEIFDLIEDQITTFELGDEILPGITAARNASWHTPGHVIYRIAAGDGPALFYAGDSVSHEIFSISQPYLRFRFDIDQAAGVSGRVDLLDFLAAEKALLVTTHATFPPLGTIIPEGLFFELQKVPPQFSASVGTMCAA